MDDIRVHLLGAFQVMSKINLRQFAFAEWRLPRQEALHHPSDVVLAGSTGRLGGTWYGADRAEEINNV
jgi:hypothetical protein